MLFVISPANLSRKHPTPHPILSATLRLPAGYRRPAVKVRLWFPYHHLPVRKRIWSSAAERSEPQTVP